ncbi:hypothetical protein KY348_02095 [Candidatus Woesearchaeota archaeon]|nr:hypothetical protein [Candidatus Woesearchaeota archaeon]
MNKRGAYFFVIDALIAGSIIFLSLIIIFTTHSIEPKTSPTLRLMEDYTDVLINTRIREFQGSYVQDLTNNSNITNLDNTLLQQLTEFYYYNVSGLRDTSAIMSGFVEEISHGIIPAQRSFAIYINKSLIYNRANIPVEQAKLVLNSKKLAFKKINYTYIYGPVIVEVKIWS